MYAPPLTITPSTPYVTMSLPLSHRALQVFRHRLEWGNGTYLDIGSNDPATSTNTLFFDKCLGWNGVCFEPQAKYHDLTRRTRSCKVLLRRLEPGQVGAPGRTSTMKATPLSVYTTDPLAIVCTAQLVPTCVSAVRATYAQHGFGQAGRLVELARQRGGNGAAARMGSQLFDRPGAKQVQREGRNLRASAEGSQHECVVASELLPSLGFGVGHRFGAIDLMSIDIEGFEAAVLRCWPFSMLPVHALLVETNTYDLREVDRWFHRHGYDNVETFSTGMGVAKSLRSTYTDNLYIRKAVLPRYPATADRFHCTGHSKRNRGWWCQPWLPWHPTSKQWGECTSSAHDGRATTVAAPLI